MGAFVAVVIFIFGIGWGVFALDEASCHSRWKQTGIVSSWGPLQGCNIKVNGQWIPEQNYREFNK